MVRAITIAITISCRAVKFFGDDIQVFCIITWSTVSYHHTSHIAHHTSHITHHTSHITHHASHITHHTSHITHHTSHITHHTSHITHHTSHITHHTSHITHTHTKWMVELVATPFLEVLRECADCLHALAFNTAPHKRRRSVSQQMFVGLQVCVCENECVCVCERERESVCVWERERERAKVCVCACVYVCVCIIVWAKRVCVDCLCALCIQYCTHTKVYKCDRW